MLIHVAPERDADQHDVTVLEPHDPLVGTILDQCFRIDFRLAIGGFGAIYRATDMTSDAEVALKVLHPQLATDPVVVARFRREWATLSSLRDPHTVTSYEHGEAPDGTLYMVMELLRGESLYERFHAHGPLPWQRVVHIARGVCSSLAEAHALGIIHRDLKPANIHLETRGNDPEFVKVLDFGIAKTVHGSGFTDLTLAGQMIGTVDYMSPEQMVGGEVTACSDIYTLGVVMYEMISGRTPFAGAEGPTALLAARLTKTPVRLTQYAPVPTELDHILMRCLERDPENRFGDVDELVDALDCVWLVDQDPTTLAVKVPTEKLALGAPLDDATWIVACVSSTLQPMTPPPTLQVRGSRSPIVRRPHSVIDGRVPQTIIGVATSQLHQRQTRPQPPRQSVPQPRSSAQDCQSAHELHQSPRANAHRGYNIPSYDLVGHERRDAMVRALLWLSVFLVATILALGVAFADGPRSTALPPTMLWPHNT
jgi:serine/threonine protein kinase